MPGIGCAFDAKMLKNGAGEASAVSRFPNPTSTNKKCAVQPGHRVSRWWDALSRMYSREEIGVAGFSTTPALQPSSLICDAQLCQAQR